MESRHFPSEGGFSTSSSCLVTAPILFWADQLLRKWSDAGTLFSGTLYSLEDEEGNQNLAAKTLVELLEDLIASENE